MKVTKAKSLNPNTMQFVLHASATSGLYTAVLALTLISIVGSSSPPASLRIVGSPPLRGKVMDAPRIGIRATNTG